ncbi:MAG: hypothetical protein H6703_12990 [Myxococcales bacterium]|nr:hypothetical protein [Myxococcales bacterium]
MDAIDAPGDALQRALRAAIDETRAASSAWRPAVAAYLFDEGLAPLHAALAAQGPVDPRLVEAAWRLMLETVATRRFGVSGPSWRAAADYPDRYYPIVWLDIVPRCLPRAAPDDRLALLTMLFNLGENLTRHARAAANAVAERLAALGPALAADPRTHLAEALAAVGLIADEQPPPSTWRRAEHHSVFDCAAIEPGFLPDAIAAVAGRRFIVVDAPRAVALHLDATAQGLVCRGRGGVAAFEVGGRVALGDVVLGLDRRTVRWRRGDEERVLGELDGVAPAALAANAQGDLVVVDAASTHLGFFRARA